MEIMNLKEMSVYLRCSQTTIRRMVRDHELPYFMIRNRYYFRKNSVDEWLKQKEEENYIEDIFGNEIRKIQ